MIKVFVLLICFYGFFNVYGQVGIGTDNPHTSSALDVTSTDKGILIPRVSLTGSYNSSPVTSPATGLLVFNTNTASDVTPGFYFWSGSLWKALSGGGSQGTGNEWSLQGNVVSDNDFIGTIQNYKPLKFKINGNNFGQFQPGGGIALGLGATSNADNAIAIGTSSEAGTSNSVAIGHSASTAGSNLSIAIGMDSKVTDHQSTALGYNTKANGHSSVALGSGASAGGLGSTALGRETSASGQYSTAIGYGATVSAPNTIRIGNNDAQIGIGTSAPSSSAVLDIQSTNKGILIPRISLSSSTDQSNVWNPVESLLIYNTNTVADVTPGFYYWQGNSWKALSGGGATGGTAPSQRAFGEVFVNSDFTVTLSQYDEQNNIGNGTSGLCNGATCSSTAIQTPSSSGAYRLTLIVTYSKTTPDSNNNLIEFHFVKNNTSIANTSIQADFNDDLKRRTVTISKIVDLQAYQSYYWGIGKSLSGSPQVKIHRDQTTFILEKL